MKFDKPAFPTVYFSENIWIQCPKCAEPALVKTELPKYTIPFPYERQSVCNCSYCGFQDMGSKNWAGYMLGFVSRACGYCGSRASHTTPPTREPYKTTNIACKVCKVKKEYDINWHRYQNYEATDPYFGFDLWLQVDIKGNVLWLYNLEHLDYLKEYVEAKLREDDGRHKYSMITNLPQ